MTQKRMISRLRKQYRQAQTPHFLDLIVFLNTMFYFLLIFSVYFPEENLKMRSSGNRPCILVIFNFNCDQVQHITERINNRNIHISTA